jgi:hypothetical protein
MLQEGLYWATLFLLRLFVKVFRYGFISHGRNRLANQALVPGVDWGTVCCASTGVVGCVALEGSDLGGGGGSSIAV